MTQLREIDGITIFPFHYEKAFQRTPRKANRYLNFKKNS